MLSLQLGRKIVETKNIHSSKTLSGRHFETLTSLLKRARPSCYLHQHKYRLIG